MVSSLIFVCSQNTCRSVAAETVFSYLAKQSGLSINIDSAGLSAQPGRAADGLLQKAAVMRGYDLRHRSTSFSSNYFSTFDLLLAVDVLTLNQLREEGGAHCYDRIKLLMDFSSYFNQNEILYPSSMHVSEFMLLFDCVEDACLGLLHALQDGFSPPLPQASERKLIP